MESNFPDTDVIGIVGNLAGYPGWEARLRLQSKLFTIIFLVTASLLITLSVTVYSLVSRNVHTLIASRSEMLAAQVLDLAELSYQINQESVRRYLQVADYIAYRTPAIDTERQVTQQVENQVTGAVHPVSFAPMTLEGIDVTASNEFVDRVKTLTGAEATIFQRIPDGLLRVSTSIRRQGGERAIGTYIPTDSPVYRAIAAGQPFAGRAFVVDAWYITQYEPIRDRDGQILGALYVGIQQSRLEFLRDKIADVRVGQSGFAYIIDGDGTILLHPTRAGEKVAANSDLAQVVEAQKTVLTWRTPEGRDRVDYLDYLPAMDWHVGIATYPDETFAVLRQMVKTMSAIASVGVLVAGITGCFLGDRIAKPITRVAATMRRVAAGDLTIAQVQVRSRDEVGDLARSVNQMIERLAAVVSRIKSEATHLAQGSVNLARMSATVAAGAVRQATAVEQVSASMVQMRAAIQHSQAKAQEARHISEVAAGQAEESGAAVTATVAAMNRIAAQIQGIEEMAKNTNLLALNAAIESSHHTDNGHGGFALFSREVRHLAQQSGLSAAEIRAVSRSSVAIAEQTRHVLGEMLPQIRSTAVYVQDIARAATEQSAGVEQITQAFTQLDAVVEQNATAAQELTQIAEELATQAQSLHEAVAFFATNQ